MSTRLLDTSTSYKAATKSESIHGTPELKAHATTQPPEVTQFSRMALWVTICSVVPKCFGTKDAQMALRAKRSSCGVVCHPLPCQPSPPLSKVTLKNSAHQGWVVTKSSPPLPPSPNTPNPGTGTAGGGWGRQRGQCHLTSLHSENDTLRSHRGRFDMLRGASASSIKKDGHFKHGGLIAFGRGVPRGFFREDLV